MMRRRWPHPYFGLLDEGAMASSMPFSSWSVILEILQSDSISSMASEDPYQVSKKTKYVMVWCCLKTLQWWKERRRKLNLSLLIFFLCFRIFFLMFETPLFEVYRLRTLVIFGCMYPPDEYRGRFIPYRKNKNLSFAGKNFLLMQASLLVKPFFLSFLPLLLPNSKAGGIARKVRQGLGTVPITCFTAFEL